MQAQLKRIDIYYFLQLISVAFFAILQSWGQLYGTPPRQDSPSDACKDFVNKPDKRGRSALHSAISSQYLKSYYSKKVIEALLDHGANVNTEDLNGQTPLFTAVLYISTSNKDASIIELLLKHSAHVQARMIDWVKALNKQTSFIQSDVQFFGKVEAILKKHLETSPQNR